MYPMSGREIENHINGYIISPVGELFCGLRILFVGHDISLVICLENLQIYMKRARSQLNYMLEVLSAHGAQRVMSGFVHYISCHAIARVYCVF